MADERGGRRRAGLDTPLESRRHLVRPHLDADLFGRWSERFARFMGTPWFLVGMTIFVVAWLSWNTWGPTHLQFDPRLLNYTLLTLILSLQASYAAPLILLAQNRQDDRDRVSFEQDRQRAERNLADTEFLAREMAALRLALGDVVTRDYLRAELRDLLEELETTAPREPKRSREGKKRREPKDRERAPEEREPSPKGQAPAPEDGGAPAPEDGGAPAPEDGGAPAPG